MPRMTTRSFLFVCGLALLGCDKDKASTDSPDEGKTGNLCTAYKSCDECIAGQQQKGKTVGEAETQCGAAVTGCWTTWDKPVVCSGKEIEQGE